MRLGIVDSDGAIVAVQQENGRFVVLSTATRKLDKDERAKDGSLIGRAGETVRVPSALEALDDCPPEAFDAHGLALVNNEGTAIRALVGPLHGFDRATFDKARAKPARSSRRPAAAADDAGGEQQPGA